MYSPHIPLNVRDSHVVARLVECARRPNGKKTLSVRKALRVAKGLVRKETRLKHQDRQAVWSCRVQP